MSMNKIAYVSLLMFCLIGTLADGFASAATLSGMFQAKNPVAQVTVVGAGIIITGLGVATKLVWTAGSPAILKGVWVAAIIVDAFTTVVAVVWFVIANMPPDTAIDLSLLYYDPSRWGQTAMAVLMTGIVTGSSVSTMYVYDRITTT